MLPKSLTEVLRTKSVIIVFLLGALLVIIGLITLTMTFSAGILLWLGQMESTMSSLLPQMK